MRLGVHRRRPRAADVATTVSTTIATAEARVIESECIRRLGHVSLDLRIDGDGIGPWQPMAHAAWPGDVDHVVMADDFWDGSLPPLTTLFARTVDPDAADVRRRMLHHLGILPLARFDDETISALPPGGLRPTDLWLLATSADHLDTDEPAVRALRAGPDLEAAGVLDAAFDELVEQVLASDRPDTAQWRLQRAETTIRAARDAAAEAHDRLCRVERESADLLDELRARLSVLEERFERDDLRRALDDGST